MAFAPVAPTGSETPLKLSRVRPETHTALYRAHPPHHVPPTCPGRLRVRSTLRTRASRTPLPHPPLPHSSPPPPAWPLVWPVRSTGGGTVPPAVLTHVPLILICSRFEWSDLLLLLAPQALHIGPPHCACRLVWPEGQPPHTKGSSPLQSPPGHFSPYLPHNILRLPTPLPRCRDTDSPRYVPRRATHLKRSCASHLRATCGARAHSDARSLSRVVCWMWDVCM
jgi:hypothetical protein